MFFDINLKDAPFLGSSLRLPAQALPNSKKNKAWFKDCMDTLETIGIRQLNVYRRRFEDAYRIVEGSYAYSDVTNTSAFLSEVDMLRSQSELSEDLQHYGFIEPIVNTLIGEYIKKPNPTIIHANDPTSTNEYLRKKRDALWKNVSEAVNAELELKLIKMGVDPNKQNFQSEEEKQAYTQKLQQIRQKNIPADVEKYMNTEWKPMYIEWAEQTLEESETRFHLDELYRELFRDYLITGRCFMHFRIGHDYFRPERWSPLNTFTSITQDERYTELGEYVGRVQYLTPNQVIQNFGHKLTEDEKRDLLKSKHYSKSDEVAVSGIKDTQSWMENNGGYLKRVPYADYIPYENIGVIQDQTGVDLGYRGSFPNQNLAVNMFFNPYDNRYDLIRVVEGYWVSYKRIGYLTYSRPGENKIHSEIVTDEILKELINEYGIKRLKSVTLDQNSKNPRENTIVWDYIPEVRYGVKILRENTDLKENLYLYGEPIKHQLKGESSMFDTLLPVCGMLENTSLVSRVEIDQIEYSLSMNMARDYMSKELGLFFLMDLAYMPEFLKDYGGDEAIGKLMEVTRNLGLLPVDSSQARGTAFNNFQMVNMDLTAAMMGKLNFAQAIKNRAFEKLGLSPQRMAMPTEQTTATGVQVTQDASYSQTEVWFDKFAKFQQRAAEMYINVAQWVQSYGIDNTVNFTDSDRMRQFVSLIDANLPLRRFKIYTQNNSKRRSELELLKQTYFRDNTISKTLEDMASVISADSTAKVLQLARLSRKQTELMQQQQQQQQMQAIEMQKAADMEKEELKQKHKIQIEKIKGEIALNKQAILALGFAKPTEEGQPAQETSLVIDQLKASTDALNQQYKNTQSAEMVRRQAIDSDRRYQIQQREINLKEKELQTRQQVAQKELQVAETNKNRYDVKS
tara:strand:- start:2018 stop:4741 length:2724 start_codon:yes stop_codon:yes gene_type:complete